MDDMEQEAPRGTWKYVSNDGKTVVTIPDVEFIVDVREDHDDFEFRDFGSVYRPPSRYSAEIKIPDLKNYSVKFADDDATPVLIDKSATITMSHNSAENINNARSLTGAPWGAKVAIKFNNDDSEECNMTFEWTDVSYV